MKVSIVIPALNEEKNIASVIRATLAQDYPSFEVIVVDNGSVDKTIDIASQFPIKVVSELRKGTNYAREKGRQVATGDVIANLDADCLPPPHWLSIGVAHMKNKNVSAVSGPYDYYDGGWLFRTLSLATQKNIYSSTNKITNSLNSGGAIIGGNVIIRASVFKKAGGYNTAIVFYGDDTDTAQRVSKYGKIIFDRNFIVKSSARRFKNEGIFKVTFLYVFYFFYVTFLSVFRRNKNN